MKQRISTRRMLVLIKAAEAEQPRQAFGKGGKPIDLSNVRPRGNPDDYPGDVMKQNHDSFMRSDLHRFAHRLIDRMHESGKSDQIISPEKFHSIALSAGIHPHELALSKAHKDQMVGHPGFTALDWANHVADHAPAFSTVNMSEKYGPEYGEWAFGTNHPGSQYNELQARLRLPNGTHQLDFSRGHFTEGLKPNQINLWHAREIFHPDTKIGNVAALQEAQYDQAQAHKRSLDSVSKYYPYNSPDISVQPAPLEHMVHQDGRVNADSVSDAQQQAEAQKKPWAIDGYGDFIHQPIMGSVRGKNQPHWDHEDFMPWYIANAVHNGADAIMLPFDSWQNGDYNAGKHVATRMDALKQFVKEAHGKYGGELGDTSVANITQGAGISKDDLIQKFRDYILDNQDKGDLYYGFDALNELKGNPIVNALANAHKYMNGWNDKLPDQLSRQIATAMADKGWKVRAIGSDYEPIDMTSAFESSPEMMDDKALSLPLHWDLGYGHASGRGEHTRHKEPSNTADLRRMLLRDGHRVRNQMFRPTTGDETFDSHAPDADFLHMNSTKLHNATREIQKRQRAKQDEAPAYRIIVEPTNEVKKLLFDNGYDPEYLSYSDEPRYDHDWELDDVNDFSRPKERFDEDLQNNWHVDSQEPEKAKNLGDHDSRLTWVLPERLKDLIKKHGVSMFGGKKAFMDLEKHVGNVVKSVLPDEARPKTIIILRKAVDGDSNPIQFRTDPESGIRYAAYEPEKWANARSKSGKSKLANRREFKTMFNKLEGLSGGEPVGVRLNINFLKNFGVPVQSIHQARTRNPWDERVQAYAHAVTVENPSFDVHQKGAYEIKSGLQSKHPMAAVVGGFVPTEPDMHRTDGEIITFNPMRYHLFTHLVDDQHIPVKSVRGNVTVHGTRVYVHPGGEIAYWGEDAPEPYNPATEPVRKRAQKSVDVSGPDNAVVAYYRAEAKR